MTRPDLNELKTTDVLNVYCSGHNLVQSIYLLSKLKRKQFDFVTKSNGIVSMYNFNIQLLKTKRVRCKASRQQLILKTEGFLPNAEKQRKVLDPKGSLNS